MGLAARAMEHPFAYRAWQAPFAERKLRPLWAHNDVRRATRVLDVGCGPGTNAGHFGGTDYLGLDINHRYVSHARERHAGSFAVADATEYAPPDGQRWDFVLVNSFLHHLPTPSVSKLLANLERLVTEDGHIHILELVLPDGRSLARALAHLDRGRHARPLERWREIFEESFRPVVLEPYRLHIFGVTLWNMVYFKGCPRR